MLLTDERTDKKNYRVVALQKKNNCYTSELLVRHGGDVNAVDRLGNTWIYYYLDVAPDLHVL